MATRLDIQSKPPTQFFSRYGFAFQQMSARECLRQFGERAATALIDEWVQFDTLGVFEGAFFHLLTPEQRKQALRLVQLIKEKTVVLRVELAQMVGNNARTFHPKTQHLPPLVVMQFYCHVCGMRMKGGLLLQQMCLVSFYTAT